MSPVTRIGGGIAVASRGLVLGEGIRLPPVTAGDGPTEPFVEDSFTGTDLTTLASHAGETGATWVNNATAGSGASQIASNRLRATSNAVTSVYYASGVPPSAEYDVEAAMVLTASGTHRTGVAGRLATAANTGYFARYESTAGYWELFKIVAGVTTQLGTYVEALSSGPYTLKLEIRDAAKKLYVGGVERISSADNEITAANRVGVRTYASSGASVNGMHIDNVTATVA